MSNKMIEIAGVKVSEDTIKEALKKYCGFEEKPKEVNVFRFRAVRSPGNIYWRLALVKDENYKWNGNTGYSNEDIQSHSFGRNEVKQIIKGLTELLGDN